MKKLLILALIITFVLLIVIVETKNNNEEIHKIEITQILPTFKRFDIPKSKYSEILALVDDLGTPYETLLSDFHVGGVYGTSAGLKIYKKNVVEGFGIAGSSVRKVISDKDGNIIAVELYKTDKEFLNRIRGYVK